MFVEVMLALALLVAENVPKEKENTYLPVGSGAMRKALILVGLGVGPPWDGRARWRINTKLAT